MNKILLALMMIFIFINLSFSQKVIRPKEKKGKWGLVQGRKKLTEHKYDFIKSSYDRGYFFTQLNKKWGVLNETGKEIVPLEYESIKDNLLGSLIVEKDQQFGVIDTSNNVLIPIQYEDVDHFSRDSIALVKFKGNWYYVNNKNEKLERDTIIFSHPDHRALFLVSDSQETNEKLRKSCSDKKMLMFVYKNMNYPQKAMQNKISGQVVISFLISPEGKIEKPKVLREIGGGCGQAGIDVVNKMDNWFPAIKDGKKVWSRFNLPIRFRLN